MKSAYSGLPNHHCVKSVTDGLFVSHDMFIYYLNQMGIMHKMAVSKVNGSWYGQVMTVILLACKEMVTRMKKLLILMVP